MELKFLFFLKFFKFIIKSKIVLINLLNINIYIIFYDKKALMSILHKDIINTNNFLDK